MTSIEDIWDAPLEPSSLRPAQPPIAIDSDEDNDHPRPSKRPRPLFLADSDDERPQGRTNNATPIDLDTMFQDVEDEEDDGLAFQPLAPDLDLDALRRQASAKHANAVAIPSLTPHAILSSSPPREDGDNDGEKLGKGKDNAGRDGERKERKKIARMNEARLLDSNGFPALIKTTKDFVPKGKGHEAADLNRLFQVYQFWTHKMYPKTQFKDTVDRVEKLCHSKRMHVSLSVWRDEAKGLINGMKPGDPDNSAGIIDITSDNEPESSPSRAKRPLPTTDADVAMVDIQSGPPSSSTEADDDDDFDIDALVKEEEERLAKMKATSSAAVASSSAQASASPAVPAPKATYRNAGADDDEAVWDELNGLGDESFPPPPPAPMPDDDEDMWDVVREMDTATDVQQPYVPPPPPLEPEHALPGPRAANENSGGAGDTSTHTSTLEESAGKDNELMGEAKDKRPTNDDDWDDMYL